MDMKLNHSDFSALFAKGLGIPLADAEAFTKIVFDTVMTKRNLLLMQLSPMITGSRTIMYHNFRKRCRDMASRGQS